MPDYILLGTKLQVKFESVGRTLKLWALLHDQPRAASREPDTAPTRAQPDLDSASVAGHRAESESLAKIGMECASSGGARKKAELATEEPRKFAEHAEGRTGRISSQPARVDTTAQSPHLTTRTRSLAARAVTVEAASVKPSSKKGKAQRTSNELKARQKASPTRVVVAASPPRLAQEQGLRPRAPSLARPQAAPVVRGPKPVQQDKTSTKTRRGDSQLALEAESTKPELARDKEKIK